MEVFLIDAPAETGFPDQHVEISNALNELQAAFGVKRMHASVESGINYRNLEPKYSYDGTHLSTEGNFKWATQIGYEIKKYI